MEMADYAVRLRYLRVRMGRARAVVQAPKGLTCRKASPRNHCHKSPASAEESGSARKLPGAGLAECATPPNGATA